MRGKSCLVAILFRQNPSLPYMLANNGFMLADNGFIDSDLVAWYYILFNFLKCQLSFSMEDFAFVPSSSGSQTPMLQFFALGRPFFNKNFLWLTPKLSQNLVCILYQLPMASLMLRNELITKPVAKVLVAQESIGQCFRLCSVGWFFLVSTYIWYSATTRVIGPLTSHLLADLPEISFHDDGRDVREQNCASTLSGFCVSQVY